MENLEKELLNNKYIFVSYNEKEQTTNFISDITLICLFEDYLRVIDIYILYKDLLIFHEKLEKNGVESFKDDKEERLTLINMINNTIYLLKKLYYYELKKEKLI